LKPRLYEQNLPLQVEFGAVKIAIVSRACTLDAPFFIDRTSGTIALPGRSHFRDDRTKLELPQFFELARDHKNGS